MNDLTISQIISKQVSVTVLLILFSLAPLTNAMAQQDDTTPQVTEEDKSYEKAKKISSSQKYFLEGKKHYNNGDYDTAMLLFDKALEANPEHAMALNYYGGAYYHKGMYDKAIEYYSKSLSLNDTAYWAYHNKGVANHHKGNFSSAINDYNQALQINENYYRSLYYRGVAHFENGNIDQAMKDFKKAIIYKPDDKRTWYLLGLCQYKSGDKEAAQKSYQRSIELSYRKLPYYTEGKNPYLVFKEPIQIVTEEPPSKDKSK